MWLQFREQSRHVWEGVPITELGERRKIPADEKFHPEAGHFGKVVWVSEDGETIAVECERSHNRKKVVFMVKIGSKK